MDKDTEIQLKSQVFCPFLSGFCKRKKCALWDENWNECGILSVSEAVERLVDVLIDRGKK